MSNESHSVSRRGFLVAAGAGLAAVQPLSERPPIDGQARAAEETARPRTRPLPIDCQSHLFCPEIVALMEKRTEDPLVYRKGGDRYVRMGDWHRRILPNHTDVTAKVAVMDAVG